MVREFKQWAKGEGGKPLSMSELCNRRGGMRQPNFLMAIKKPNRSEYTFGNPSICSKDSYVSRLQTGRSDVEPSEVRRVNACRRYDVDVPW